MLLLSTEADEGPFMRFSVQDYFPLVIRAFSDTSTTNTTAATTDVTNSYVLSIGDSRALQSEIEPEAVCLAKAWVSNSNNDTNPQRQQQQQRYWWQTQLMDSQDHYLDVLLELNSLQLKQFWVSCLIIAVFDVLCVDKKIFDFLNIK